MSEFRDKIARKSKFGSQLRVILKKFRTKDLVAKEAGIWRPNSIENKGEIEEIKGLKVS